MRTLFLVLLLANALFYAWWRYGSGEAPDAAPLARQIEPDKLKVIPAAALPPPAAAK